MIVDVESPPGMVCAGFRAMADETRLRALAFLAEGERCVCDIADYLDVPQPLLSHHLRVLREAGLVTLRREGRWCHYAINKPAFEGLHEAVVIGLHADTVSGACGC